MTYLSPEGLEKLKKELIERKTVRRKEIARHLEEAKSLGDLSENTEYSSAKEEQAFNEARILELEDLIKKARLIKPSRQRGQKKVQLGSVIKVKLLGGSQKNNLSRTQTFTIVGSQESEPSEGKISNESPLGRAFLGHRVNDIIEVETPKGLMKYKIISIE